MKQIPLTKGKFALIDDDDYGAVSQHSWCFQGRYAFSRINGKNVSMHRFINKTPANLDTDHINGNELDNRKANLRSATRKQNIMNARKRSGTSSKYKGVCWNNRDRKWQAKIKVGEIRLHLGYFSTEQDAAQAYNFAAIKGFGEYARLNTA